MAGMYSNCIIFFDNIHQFRPKTTSAARGEPSTKPSLSLIVSNLQKTIEYRLNEIILNPSQWAEKLIETISKVCDNLPPSYNHPSPKVDNSLRDSEDYCLQHNHMYMIQFRQE